jgi:hypothetical protein
VSVKRGGTIKAQIKLGRIFGVEIGLHYSWFIIARGSVIGSETMQSKLQKERNDANILSH